MPKLLRTLAARDAIAVLFRQRTLSRESICALINRSDNPAAVADFAARKCLARYRRSTKRRLKLLCDDEALSFAIDLAIQIPLKHATARAVVGISAEAGFHGRFPELPKLLLGRAPNEKEVVALVGAYVNDKVCRSTSTEEKLAALVRLYVKSEKAEAALERLRQFGAEWDADMVL